MTARTKTRARGEPTGAGIAAVGALAAAAAAAALVAAPAGLAAAAQERPGRPPAAGERGTSGSTRDAPPALAFRDVRLFDGERVRDDVDVLVEGDRIAAVGSDLEVPEGAEVVDGSGRTLLPGLIDAHVHTFGRRHLRRAAVLGVTTELDMFTLPQTARKMKREQAAGRATDRADLFSSGYLATAPGGHGTEYGVEVPTLEGPGDAAAWVDARVEGGADYIKIVYDDGSVAGVSFPTLDLRTVERLVEEAHAHDRLAVVHVSSLRAAREVVGAGADVLAHVWMDSVPDRATVRSMEESGVAVTPTLAVIEGAAGAAGAGGRGLVDDPRLRPYLHPEAVGQLEQGFPDREGGRASLGAALESVGLLHEAGVPLLAGTDAPNPGTAHGASLHRELELLVEAGLEPREALEAATATPAEVFGLDDRGRVEEGRRADLLLVEGDPTSDVGATRNVVGVWKAGGRIDRGAYRERVAAAREGGGDAAGGPPAGAGSGLVSDFESGEPEARFGAGWRVSTDEMMGGASTASMRVVDGGADGSSGSLLVEGEISGDSRFPWAGAMFVPGSSMQQAADLSAWDAISFRARGDGGVYRLMAFSRSTGRRPVTHTFEAGREWERHVVPFSELPGVDGSGLRAVLFSAGSEPGGFRLRIDEVRFVESGSAD